MRESLRAGWVRLVVMLALATTLVACDSSDGTDVVGGGGDDTAQPLGDGGGGEDDAGAIGGPDIVEPIEDTVEPIEDVVQPIPDTVRVDRVQPPADVPDLPPDTGDPSMRWPEGVAIIDLPASGQGTLSGEDFARAPRLTDGEHDWAHADTVGCWEDWTLQYVDHRHHRFFALKDPVAGDATLTVTATPSGDADVSLYVYRVPVDSFPVPPEVDTVGLCLAGINTDFGGNPGVAEVVEMPFVGGAEHNVFIGVIGDEDATFDLDIELADMTGACWDDVGAHLSFPDWVEPIEVVDGAAVVRGDLAHGAPVCELDFAWNSSVACFPETVERYFQGNTVFYSIELPSDSALTLTATPDPGVEVSLYALQMGTTSFYVPPYVPSVTTCEASHGPAAYSEGGTVVTHPANPGQAESVFLNSTRNPYNILVAVSGDDETGLDPSLGGGGFSLAVDLITWSGNTCTDDDYVSYDRWPSFVEKISFDGGSAHLEGDLADGDTLCSLEFAWNSSVACFPGTDDMYFGGNHVFYAFEEPVPGNSQLNIVVTPDPDVDVSVYGYWMSPESYYLPPFVPSVGACEAAYAARLDKLGDPGVAETISFQNPTDNVYNIAFAVVGHEDGGFAGAYDIDIELVEAPGSNCPESLPGATYPDWPGNVKQIELSDEGSYATDEGELADGACTDLTFASSSAVACFPATQNGHFTGNHVFYALSEPIPPRSVLTITASPGPGTEVSLYGYQSGTTNYYVPPNVPSVVACEASHARQSDATNPGEPETIQFFNPSDTNEYNIFFAVAGDGQTGLSGHYDLQIQLDVGEVHCEESLPGDTYTSWPPSVTQVSLDTNDEAQVDGNLSAGGCTNLDFASNSSVACFPATDNVHFMGNHVYYALDEPLPPRSYVVITAEPRPDVDVSLYGYQLGETNYRLPPNVPSVAACEASFSYDLADRPNPGVAESIAFYNPTENNLYNIFFAVAGNGTSGDAGAYTVNVAMTRSVTHCEESLPGQRFDAWPSSVNVVSVAPGAPTDIPGNLADGGCVNLGWADDSSVACWPETQNTQFKGNVVYYALARTLPADKMLTATVTPAPGVDVSLFTYLTGTDDFLVPPYVPQVPNCEAVHAAGPGQPETTSIYNRAGAHNVFIGVAGVEGATGGGYTLSLTVEPAPGG